jgi:hypothetical protein
MSDRAFGISSNVVPDATPAELLAQARACAADCVDVRAGVGQGWEEAPADVLDSIPVVFVGTSACLGAPGGLPEPSPGVVAAVARGLPLRCFLAGRARSVDVRRDVEGLRRMWGHEGPILIEPHGELSIDELRRALAASDGRLVADVNGLSQLRGATGEIREVAAAFGAVVHVKGFERPGGPHVALRSAEYARALVRKLLCVLPGTPVTVETKSGTYVDDLLVVRSLDEEHGAACA